MMSLMPLYDRKRYCMNWHLSGVKRANWSKTNSSQHLDYDYPYILLIHGLEVVLEHEPNKKRELTVRCEEDQEKTGSATSIAMIYLLVVTQEHDMKARTEKNLSKWDNNAALVGIYQLNMLMNWQSEWTGDWCTRNKKEFNLSHYNGW